MIVSRKTSRRTWRRPQRKRTRASVRSLPGFGRGPDDLSQALAAKERKERKIHGLRHVRPHFAIHLPGDNTIRHNSFSL